MTRSDIKDADVLRILAEHGPLAGIDIARELIARRQTVNAHAIGVVQPTSVILERMVREGKVQVVCRRDSGRGFAKKKIYALASEAAA